MSSLTEETQKLRARYDEEPTHSDHVTALSLQLFDGLQAWHRLPSRLRDLLQCASLLHDIGWSQTPDGSGHHKESARLIREHVWKNLSADEVALVAQVARYHRKSIPKTSHTDFQALAAPIRKTVMILGGILRLADALDRTHAEKITGLNVSIDPAEIVVHVEASGAWDAEKGMFESKRDLLELAVERPVICQKL